MLQKEILEKCPRCRGRHEVEIRKFTIPSEETDPANPINPCTYHYWATCPDTGEPVLFKDGERNSIYVPVEPNRDDVAKLAYKLWCIRGRPQGRDLDHWLIAEAALTKFFEIQSWVTFKEEISLDAMKDIKQRCDERAAQVFRYELDREVQRAMAETGLVESER